MVKLSSKCHICGESKYELLDVHRIVFGENGGTYNFNNVVVLCPRHHRMVHTGLITIHGWVDSTVGKLLHFIDEDGKEQFS